MLFAGTGHAFYYSLDDGAHWTKFNEGLPHTAVSWIVVPKKWHDVVVSTYGRGVFILRDIAPLESDPQTIADGDDSVSLYAPHPGYRQARSGRAEITFALEQGVAAAGARRDSRLGGQGRAHDSVADARGLQSRDVGSALRRAARRRAAHAGAGQRAHLPGAALQQPADAPDHALGNSGRADRRPARARRARTPCASPSTARRETQPLVDSQGSGDQDDATPISSPSTQAQVRVRDDMNARGRHGQPARDDAQADPRSARRRTPRSPTSTRALADLDKKMLDVELQLLSRSDMNSDDKYYVEPYKIYMNLIWLNGVVGNGAGDVAGGADYRADRVGARVARRHREGPRRREGRVQVTRRHRSRELQHGDVGKDSSHHGDHQARGAVMRASARSTPTYDPYRLAVAVTVCFR